MIFFYLIMFHKILKIFFFSKFKINSSMVGEFGFFNLIQSSKWAGELQKLEDVFCMQVAWV